MQKIYRLMCDRCGEAYPLYDGYHFFVEIDVTLCCCRKPQRLEVSEATYPAHWQTALQTVTPRQFYILTEQPVTIDWCE